MKELKSIAEVDAALAAGQIKTLGDLVEAWPQAAFDLGLEDSLPVKRQPTDGVGNTITVSALPKQAP